MGMDGRTKEGRARQGARGERTGKAGSERGASPGTAAGALPCCHAPPRHPGRLRLGPVSELRALRGRQLARRSATMCGESEGAGRGAEAGRGGGGPEGSGGQALRCMARGWRCAGGSNRFRQRVEVVPHASQRVHVHRLHVAVQLPQPRHEPCRAELCDQACPRTRAGRAGTVGGTAGDERGPKAACLRYHARSRPAARTFPCHNCDCAALSPAVRPAVVPVPAPVPAPVPTLGARSHTGAVPRTGQRTSRCDPRPFPSYCG